MLLDLLQVLCGPFSALVREQHNKIHATFVSNCLSKNTIYELQALLGWDVIKYIKNTGSVRWMENSE